MSVTFAQVLVVEAPSLFTTASSGWEAGPVRIGDTVRRRTGHWTPAVHALPMAAFANMMALSKTASGDDGRDPANKRGLEPTLHVAVPDVWVVPSSASTVTAASIGEAVVNPSKFCTTPCDTRNTAETAPAATP